MNQFCDNNQTSNISADKKSLRYIEIGSTYSEVPQWVRTMINFGYTWKKDTSRKGRKVALISTPCKSPSAALITLGSIRGDLEKPDANLAVGYFEFLKGRLQRLLELDQDVFLINEYGHKWILSSIESDEFIRVLDSGYRNYVKRNGKKIKNPNGRSESFIGAHNAKKWRILGDPLVESIGELDSTIYNLIVDDAGEIFEKNLKSSWLNTLYVGKASGVDTEYWKYLESISFKTENVSANLIELLTMTPDKSSLKRIRYSTAANVSESNYGCSLIIADGVKAFLNSIDSQRQSDVIGVISRDEDPGAIQSVVTKLSDMNRYYVSYENKKMSSAFPPTIACKLFERR